MPFSIFSIYEFAGLTGFFLYMLAYFLLLVEKIQGTSVAYIMLNLVAAGLVLISLTADFNLASLLIQLFWILISIVGLVRHKWRGGNEIQMSELSSVA